MQSPKSIAFIAITWSYHTPVRQKTSSLICCIKMHTRPSIQLTALTVLYVIFQPTYLWNSSGDYRWHFYVTCTFSFTFLLLWHAFCHVTNKRIWWWWWYINSFLSLVKTLLFYTYSVRHCLWPWERSFGICMTFTCNVTCRATYADSYVHTS